MRKITLLLAFLLMMVGGSQVWADEITDDFSGYETTTSGTTLGDNWVILPGTDGSYGAFGSSRDYVHYNAYGEHYVAGNANSNYTKGVWLVLKKQVAGTVKFTATNGNSNSAFTIYVSKANASGDTYATIGEADSYSVPARTSTAKEYTYDAGTDPTYVAFCLVGTSKNPKLQSVTYTEYQATEEAKLTVEGFATGSAFDFGHVAAGTTKSFTLKNLGKATLNVTSIAATSGYTVSEGADITTIAGESEATVTVATPAADATGALTITSDDATNPTYTINLTSTYKAPAPVMELPETSFNFGKVTAEVSHTFTVKNTGDAVLEATVTSDNALFEVSKAALTVAAGTEETFDVTFKYTDELAYGVHNAVVTVNGEEISVAAKIQDPDEWAEDFDDDPTARGWEVDASGWTVAGGVATGKFGSYYLTTPALEVVTGDEMTFIYNRDYAKLIIEKNKDNEGWTSLYSDDSYTTDNDWATYTISGLEAGNYKFRFKGDTYSLDEFKGFKLVPAKDHEAEIKLTTIAATGNQYVEYSATVEVKVTGTSDETLTATLYIGETLCGSATETVSSKDTKTITVAFTPETAMSGDAYFTIASEEGSINITSETTAVNIVAAPVLDETVGLPSGFTSGTKPVIVVDYTPVDGWNTICMPFALNTDMLTTIFGEGYKAFTLSEYDSDTDVIKFSETTSFSYGTPYLVYVAKAATHNEPVTLQNVYTYNYGASNTSKYDSGNYIYFRGTYAPVAAGSMSDTWYGVTSGGEIRKAGNSASLKGFRAYFTGIPETATARIMIDGGDMLGISDLQVNSLKGEVYNLNGQKMRNAQKGLYIVDGKKVIKK